jgi:hypothetical protein
MTTPTTHACHLNAFHTSPQHLVSHILGMHAALSSVLYCRAAAMLNPSQHPQLMCCCGTQPHYACRYYALRAIPVLKCCYTVGVQYNRTVCKAPQFANATATPCKLFQQGVSVPPSPHTLPCSVHNRMHACTHADQTMTTSNQTRLTTLL